jgi:hypothetical protein
MSDLTLIQQFWIAVRDVRRAVVYIFRPWTDLRAVKTTQVDVVNVVSGFQADIADALASLNKLSRQVARLEARTAEHEAVIRQVRQRADSALCDQTRDSNPSQAAK